MQKKDVSEVVLAAIHELSKSLEEGIHAVNELKELLPLTQSELNAWIKDTINTEGEESRRVDLVIAMSNNWRQIIHGIKESEEIIDNWIRRIEKDPFDISWDISGKNCTPGRQKLNLSWKRKMRDHRLWLLKECPAVTWCLREKSDTSLREYLHVVQW